MYDKYLELKKDFKDAIVFIKSGKFYRSYDEDAIILNYLFNYQIIDNKVGFPMEGLFKVKSKLRYNKINYVIVDGNDIFKDEIEDNSYNNFLLSGTSAYEKRIKTEEILTLVRERLDKDSTFFDKLNELL